MNLVADTFEVQCLAVSVVAEIEAFRLMPGFEACCISTNRNGHGFEAFRTGEASAFAGQSRSYVIFKRDRGQNYQHSVICFEMERKRTCHLKTLLGLQVVVAINKEL